jgi:hypothetical protein
VSCENCKEGFEVDGTEPDCWDGECKLPALCATGQRILEIRDRIITLQDIVDPGSILRMYGADLEDIELLAEVEEEIRRLNPGKE